MGDPALTVGVPATTVDVSPSRILLGFCFFKKKGFRFFSQPFFFGILDWGRSKTVDHFEMLRQWWSVHEVKASQHKIDNEWNLTSYWRTCPNARERWCSRHLFEAKLFWLVNISEYLACSLYGDPEAGTEKRGEIVWNCYAFGGLLQDGVRSIIPYLAPNFPLSAFYYLRASRPRINPLKLVSLTDGSSACFKLNTWVSDVFSDRISGKLGELAQSLLKKEKIRMRALNKNYIDHNSGLCYSGLWKLSFS